MLIGLLCVAAGAVFQLVMVGQIRPGPVTVAAVAMVLILAVAVILRRRVAPVARLTAIVLALDFAAAVADRLGLVGSVWGSWDAFEAYTGRLLPFLPDALIGPAAVSATVGEAVLAIWLASGRRRRWAGRVAAILLGGYLLAMAVTMGWTEVARFAFPLQIGGALLLAALPDGGHGRTPRQSSSKATPSKNAAPSTTRP
jgi:hypothetical protein